MKARFEALSKKLAARICRDAGQSIKEIAASAKKSPSTIRRWLKVTDHMRNKS